MPNEFANADLEWIASDVEGCLAVFTVAGGGPVPAHFRSWSVLEQVSEFVRGLPVVTTAEVLVSLPRPDDYIGFATRGLFAYDWTDFHRSKSDELNSYELISRPGNPVNVSEIDMPASFRTIITSLPNVSFGEDVQVRIVEG